MWSTKIWKILNPKMSEKLKGWKLWKCVLKLENVKKIEKMKDDNRNIESGGGGVKIRYFSCFNNYLWKLWKDFKIFNTNAINKFIKKFNDKFSRNN